MSARGQLRGSWLLGRHPGVCVDVAPAERSGSGSDQGRRLAAERPWKGSGSRETWCWNPQRGRPGRWLETKFSGTGMSAIPEPGFGKSPVSCVCFRRAAAESVLPAAWPKRDRQMKTQQKYIWSKREFTDEGHPLIEVIDQGLTRVKNASDSVGIVLKELKAQCQSGTFKLVVGVDGVNALWGQTTLRKEDKSPNNGAVVATVTQTGSLFTPKAAYLPHELLGKDGFDFLDPFLPIQVTGYSEREFESCYQYYKDRHWIQHEKGANFAV
ncbi:RT29 protein, partial [Polypterus senegalus]